MAAETKTGAPRAPLRRFYAAALSAAEAADLPVALDVEGVDEEIAVLRLRLREVLSQRPEDLPLMFKGIELLAKLVATRYRLSKRAERDLAGALANVIRGVGDLLPEGDADA